MPGSIDPEPTDFERRLAALRPSAAPLDRDRMLYEAGRAAGRGDRLATASAACLGLLAIALGGLLARERSERRALETVIAGRDHPAAPISSPPTPHPIEPDSYLALRREALAGRFDPPKAVPTDLLVPESADSPPPLRVRARSVDL